ncbi:MAG: hypothetical protein WDN49_26475 [Acetobacteraceae bacterium]
MEELIEITRNDGWAQLRINRDSKRNAMNRAARTGLLHAFEALRGEGPCDRHHGDGRQLSAPAWT